MQTLKEIRSILRDAGLQPNRRLGQCFLVDRNLMDQLVELARVPEGQTVLEVGPGTGALTEELLPLAGQVVAVELDRGLARVLTERLGDHQNLRIIQADVLAGKHRIEPAVLTELGDQAHLVSNLPYQIATPLVAQCLLSAWSALTGRPLDDPSPCRFERLTFTVQREVADRMTAGPGSGDYGPISVLVGLLGKVRVGPSLPPTAFWPAPKVYSRALRIDVPADRAGALADMRMLQTVLALAFQQRRKQLGSVARRKNAPLDAAQMDDAMAATGVDPRARAEQVAPEQYLALANALSGGPRQQRPGR